MKGLIYIMNDATLLDALLEELSKAEIKGCTIFDTDGMGRELVKRHDVFEMMFGSLRNMLKTNVENTKTLLMVLKDERVSAVIEAIEKVVGNLDDEGTGLVFTFPIDYTKGLKL